MTTLLKLKQSQLSLNEALVLSHILQHPGCRQKDIQKTTDLNPTVISSIVKRFTQRKLLTEEKKAEPGSRNWAKIYSLKKEGLKMVAPFCFPDIFGDVLAFSKKFDFPIAAKLSRNEELDLVNHLREEVQELSEAYAEEDREKQFDAFLDLVYLAARYCVVHGFKFDEGWRRVQAANMAKVKVPSAKDSKRGSKHDVLKPAGWAAPVLSDLV